MNEGLRSRVGRIISGSLNALVSAVEGMAPEMILEQSLNEIDATIEETRQEMGKVVAEKYAANKRLSEKNAKHETLSEQIQTALNESREDLAEAAVSKQLDLEAQMPLLEQAIADHNDKEKELESFIQALQAKKRELREELTTFAEARAQSGESSSETHAPTGASSEHKVNAAMDKADSVFERILSKHGVGMEGSSDAKTEAKLQELENLTRDNRVKERLAILKSKNKQD